MRLNDPWSDSLYIIDLKTVKKIGIKPMGLSKPWGDSIYIIAFHPVKK